MGKTLRGPFLYNNQPKVREKFIDLPEPVPPQSRDEQDFLWSVARCFLTYLRFHPEKIRETR